MNQIEIKRTQYVNSPFYLACQFIDPRFMFSLSETEVKIATTFVLSLYKKFIAKKSSGAESEKSLAQPQTTSNADGKK